MTNATKRLIADAARAHESAALAKRCADLRQPRNHREWLERDCQDFAATMLDLNTLAARRT